MERDYTALDAAIAALPINYAAHFVPQSASRNAGEKHRTINWRLAFTPKERGAAPLVCDYSQGIGHVPHIDKIRPRTNDRHHAEYEAAEKGRAPLVRMGQLSSFGFRSLPPPALRDVLYSLVMDANVLHYSYFEQWAADFGYDADSREAERTYTACLNQSRALVALIGTAALRDLEAHFTDY